MQLSTVYVGFFFELLTPRSFAIMCSFQTDSELLYEAISLQGIV